jgi:hypothetical protein
VRAERVENPNVKLGALVTNYREEDASRRVLQSQMGSMAAEIRELRKKFITSNF